MVLDQPPRFERARALRSALAADGIHFAPVRHHSPACAHAVAALIAEVAPVAILIEGPEEYTGLVPELARPEMVPPIAVLSHLPRAGGGHGGGYYPLAASSPEWVALRAGAERGAAVAFIDDPWDMRLGDEEADLDEEALARTIQAERHLAHSRTLAELARREHCRDHDELWDHLFELRGTAASRDWRRLFDDVFAWSALARLDYEPEVLLGDGSIRREARMSARIREWRSAVDGPIVVITGAFHTLAIVEALAGSEEGEPVRAAQPADGYGPVRDAEGAAWLIRYDFPRLDALGGYGAGMPSPGYYDRTWHAPDDDELVTRLLVEIGRAASASGTTDLVSTADVTNATLQAHRLATLRGRARPGRTDLLDAISSCLVKDVLGPSAALREAIASVFVGNRLGQVPPDTIAPPIVAEARARASALRFSIDDSARRQVSLDVRRTPAHRRRSRFLALMEFLGTGFARRIGGPDLVAGRALGRLHEEWEYAWTPLVEAALIEIAVDGTLDAAARARLATAERELAETGGRSAAQAVSLLVQAAVIGLADELPRLRTLVRDAMDADPSLDSVVGAGHRLARLIEARDQLDLDDPAELQALLAHVVPTAAFLVPSLGLAPAEAEDAAVGTLVSLRDLMAGLEADVTPVHRELERLRHDPTTAPGVAGALHAHAALDGEVSDDEFVAVVVAQLGAGADVDRAVRFLSGVMRAAPDLLLHDPAALAAVHRAVVDLPADTFLAYLPDLRRAFSWLKPSETDRLAERIAAGVGVTADAINAGAIGATGAELAQGVALERRLVAGLTADGLGVWTEEVA